MPKVVYRSSERLQFAYLDGLRGLAAFYVLLFHVVGNGIDKLSGDRLFLNLLGFGHEAVVVFIVLSGFLLTIPVLRSPRFELDGGVWGFIVRRARRILPGYYAALLMYPLFIATVELLKYATGVSASGSRLRDLFISNDMMSHLFLLQNLSTAWAYSTSLNPLLWSVSTEWWIYFVFALLLLPIWRRFGSLLSITSSILLSLAPTAMIMLGIPTLSAYPHMLGAFGLGMASAYFVMSNRVPTQWTRTHNALMLTSFTTFLIFICVAIAASQVRLGETTRWITDLLVAAFCACFMCLTGCYALSGLATGGFAKIAIRFLELGPLLFLGRISYSLYLTHLVAWAMIGITLGLAPVKRLVMVSVDPMPVRVFVLIPLLLVFACIFHLIFERPFMRHRGFT